MEITNFTERDWGKIKATFDFTTNCGLIIKDMKLIDGEKGLFVSGPAKPTKNKEGEEGWFNFITIPQETQDLLIDKCSTLYNPNPAPSKDLPF